jgi:hypothetical protein
LWDLRLKMGQGNNSRYDALPRTDFPGREQ